MATTYSMPTFSDPAKANVNTGEVTRLVTMSPASWVLADVFKVAQLPLGARLLHGWYAETADVDSSTGALADIIVVDGNTTKTIGSGISAQAATLWFDQTATTGQQTGWVNYKIATTGAYVAWKANAAKTGTFTTGSFLLQFKYTTDQEFNTA